MAINEVEQEYDTQAKSEWRYLCHYITPSTCNHLVDEHGIHQFKRLELVAKGAKTFSHSLSTGKISEDKLIGINDNKDIIESCKPLFPLATLVHSTWENFCITYNDGDIGTVVFDSCYAGYGPLFEKALRITLSLVAKSINNIGECMLIINIDGDKTYRGKASKRKENVDAITKAKLTMCDTINKILNSHSHVGINTVSISPKDIYEYKQKDDSTTMLSCFLLLG